MKRLSFLLTLSILIFLIPVSLFSQEKEVILEPVVVTATRDIQEIRKIPANVTVITKEQIEKSNALTTVDLLRSELSVVVRDWTGSGKTVNLDLRGFGETGPTNTLVLIDGRRVNEIDLSGVDWTQIPLDQIEKIEIVRGPGSVLYGDNAVGGVINIITKKPEKKFSVKGEIVRGSYLFHKESSSVSGKWDKIGAMVYGDYSSTEGYRDNGFLRYKDFGGKFIFDPNKDIQIIINGNFHKDDYGLPGALPLSIYKYDRRSTLNPDDKAETEDGFLNFGVKLRFNDFSRFEIDLSYRDREVSDSFLSDLPIYSFKSRKNLNTWGITPKYILEKPIGKHFNKITTGFDFYNSVSDIDSELFFFGFNTFDSIQVKKKSFGVYLLDEFSILENLILSLGGRWEWATYNAFQDSSAMDDMKRESEPAWSFGLDYIFGKRSSAFFAIKKSFRLPATDEFIQYMPTFQINSAMKPQRGYHYEIGIRHSLNDWIEGNITLFRMDLKNEIFYNPFTWSNENYPKTRRDGIEIGTNIKPFTWLTLWGNYNYIKPKLRSGNFSGNDIPGVSRHKGSIGGDFELGKGFSLNTRFNIIGSSYLISDWQNQSDKLDGYYTLDAKISYTWRGFKAYFGVNNLTDRKYSEYGVVSSGQSYFYPSPERNFFGGISYIF